MITITGVVEDGVNNFTSIIKTHMEKFREILGVDPEPGTLNLRVEKCIKIQEQYRILGSDIGRPHEDFLMEECEVEGLKALWIRPYNLITCRGGHGDDVIEIVSQFHLRRTLNLSNGSKITIRFYRDIPELQVTDQSSAGV